MIWQRGTLLQVKPRALVWSLFTDDAQISRCLTFSSIIERVFPLNQCCVSLLDIEILLPVPVDPLPTWERVIFLTNRVDIL